MYKVITLEAAQHDIRKAVSWYEGKKKGLGKRFSSKLKEKTQFIRENPKAAPLKYHDIRTAVMDVFPYMIHYTVDDQYQCIFIAAVFHAAQNPEDWIERIE